VSDERVATVFENVLIVPLQGLYTKVQFGVYYSTIYAFGQRLVNLRKEQHSKY
jgi:hypothetical protein